MAKVKSLKVSIKGMHCRSCELLVEDNIKSIKNIRKVKISYKTGEAEIAYKGEKPSDKEIEEAIFKSGYKLNDGEEKTKIVDFSENKLMNLLWAVVVILFIYILAKQTGLMDINIGSQISEPSYLMVIVIGLVAGISTCMAIVGGIILSLSAKFTEKHPEANKWQRLKPNLNFILGRIIGYGILGGLLGSLGSVLKLSNNTNAILTLLVGLLMLLIGLQLTKIFPVLNKINISLPANLARFLKINKKKEKYSNKGAFILGALTFFLPCGFTQAMQVYAISRGTFLEGAIIMSLFAIGTAPGIFGLGGIIATVKNNKKEVFLTIAGLAIIIFGIFNIYNSTNLLKLNFSSDSDKEINTELSDQNISDYQVIEMVEHNRGYTPNRFTIKKDVPVKWVIDAQAPYSCAAALIIPKLNIRKYLEPGENIIEFTPTETGQIKFSCSMGMYSGVFNVVD